MCPPPVRSTSGTHSTNKREQYCLFSRVAQVPTALMLLFHSESPCPPSSSAAAVPSHTETRKHIHHTTFVQNQPLYWHVPLSLLWLPGGRCPLREQPCSVSLSCGRCWQPCWVWWWRAPTAGTRGSCSGGVAACGLGGPGGDGEGQVRARPHPAHPVRDALHVVTGLPLNRSC